MSHIEVRWLTGLIAVLAVLAFIAYSLGAAIDAGIVLLYGVFLLHPGTRHIVIGINRNAFSYAEPLTLPFLRAYDELNAGLKKRKFFYNLYRTEYADQFSSYQTFLQFYDWVSVEREPVTDADARVRIAAAVDACGDGEVLMGLPNDYTKETVKARYLELMKMVHPDVAGPNDIARRLNVARDLILERRGWK